MHDQVEFAEEVMTEYIQRANKLITHTVVSDTLHAEPLNLVNSKVVAGYMDEMNKLIEGEGDRGGHGEEIILKNGKPAFSLFGDRTHAYTPRRCWLDWGENRHRYVRRLGCTPARTGLRYEERVEQSLSADKTVKNLTCLLFDVPTDLGLQLGRANAVCRRIHPMLKHGQRSIDDEDGRLGDDGHACSEREGQDGGGEFGAARQIS